jgi:glycosyltransferase involved in cell wall biosynthesis
VKLLVVATFAHPDHYGGAERVITEVATRLAGRGHDVTLLTSNPGEAPPREECEGVAWHRYDVDRRSPARFYRSVFHGVRARLGELAAGADILALHQMLSGVAALAPGAPRIPTVLTFHAPYHEEYLARHREGRPEGAVGAGPRALATLLRLGDRRLVRRARQVLVLSRFARQQAEALDASVTSRLTLAPAGVDLQRFRPPADADEAAACRGALGLPADIPLVVSVRRLVPRMGLSDLVEAVGRTPHAHLAVAGDGPERPALERRVTEAGLGGRIHLLGRVTEDQLPELYRAADVFALPTRALEGFGMATAEALAAGLPVVATRVGANEEVLGDVHGARLVPPEDPAALAAALSELLDDETGRRRAAQAARRHAEQALTWEGHLQAFETAAERARGERS